MLVARSRHRGDVDIVELVTQTILKADLPTKASPAITRSPRRRVSST